MAYSKAGPFQLQEIVENTLEHLHSWKDYYSFATTCQYLYIVTITLRINLPWILKPEDLANKCGLPKKAARSLVLFNEIINTPTNIWKTIPDVLAEFSFTTKIFISHSTLLSKNCAGTLLTELNKSNRKINVYIDKKDKAWWEYIQNHMEKQHAIKKINVVVYKEVYVCYDSETLNGWTSHQIPILFTYFLEPKQYV